MPPAQNEPRNDIATGGDQKRAPASSTDSWESQKQVRFTPECVAFRNRPLSFPIQNRYHNAQSEYYEPSSNDFADSKPPCSPGTGSPSNPSNDSRDSFKSSAPSSHSEDRKSQTNSDTARSQSNPDAILETGALSGITDSTIASIAELTNGHALLITDTIHTIDVMWTTIVSSITRIQATSRPPTRKVMTVPHDEQSPVTRSTNYQRPLAQDGSDDRRMPPPPRTFAS